MASVKQPPLPSRPAAEIDSQLESHSVKLTCFCDSDTVASFAEGGQVATDRLEPTQEPHPR